MSLVIGTIMLCISVVYFAIVYLGARNPGKPVWANQAWVATHAFLLTSMVFASTGYLVKFGLNMAGTRMADYAVAGGALLATMIFLKTLGFKKRLDRYGKPKSPAAHAM